MSTTDSPTEQITKTNQRLFNRYAAVFMKPESPAEFINHVHKLAEWLGDFKAYYCAARPEIIRLLLIAHRTICTSLNANPSSFNVSQYPNDTMVQEYCNLIRTVEKYKDYFQQEPGSFAHIQALVSTVHNPYQPSLPSNQMTSWNQPHSSDRVSCPGGQTYTRTDPEVQIISKPSNFPDPDIQEIQSTYSTTMIQSAPAKNTRPKVKKRKTIDFSLLVEEDIKGLVQKKAAQPSNFQHNDQEVAGSNVFSTSILHSALIHEQSPVSTTDVPVNHPNTTSLLEPLPLADSCLSGPHSPFESQHLSQLQSQPESQPPLESHSASGPHLQVVSEPQTSRSESPPGKIGSSIHLIAKQDGLAYQGRMTIRFNISDSTYTMISNWVKVNSMSNEIIPIKSCICLSFGCYSSLELKNLKDTTLQDQLEAASATWPPSGSLSMIVQFKGNKENIPLSPPIKITPNTLVDMCPFIVCGENTIDVMQKQDLSQYTFVLFAHWPSKGQVAQVRQSRKKEQDWKNWMVEVTKPLKVPSVDYSQAIIY